jgi:hypothetical protein
MVKKLALLLVILVAVAVVSHPFKRTEETSVRKWNTADSKAYAMDSVQAWADKQYVCLNKLWKKESNWRPNAYNKHKVMGKNAGGIPQLLGMSTQTPAPLQIDRGLSYIINRYGTPCAAWRFHQKKGWY